MRKDNNFKFFYCFITKIIICNTSTLIMAVPLIILDKKCHFKVFKYL